jgi:hypothetical protein
MQHTKCNPVQLYKTHSLFRPEGGDNRQCHSIVILLSLEKSPLSVLSILRIYLQNNPLRPAVRVISIKLNEFQFPFLINDCVSY